jgi:ribonucleoside-diphosphate reductase alpha chain
VDYIFRWLGSRFLSPDDKASLGLIDRSAIVDEAPGGFGAGLSESAPLGGRELAAFANPPDAVAAPAPIADVEPEPESKPDEDQPKATAVATESVPAVPEELKVIANGKGHTNGHANGNGNGHAEGSAATPITLTLGSTKVSFQTQADAPSCADCGSIMVRNGSCYKCLNCGSTSGCS